MSVNFVSIQKEACQRYSSAVYILQDATLDMVDIDTYKPLYYLIHL